MKKKLSHSACTTYMQCPASFDYKYNQRIYPIKTGSALVFGGAMDAALNELLMPTGVDPMELYRAQVAKTPIGLMIPGKEDYDHELLSDKEKADLLLKVREFGYTGDDVDDLAARLVAKNDLIEKRKSDEVLSENQEKAVDTLVRASLEAKAKLMLEAYKLHVLPNIKQVYNVQKNSGPGILDATVEWAGRGKIIIDNKTSGKPYPDNAVEYSAQLAMYAAEEKITQVAYVVLLKPIEKNRERVCPECGNRATGSHRTCNAMVDFGNAKLERCDSDWSVTIAPEAKIQIVHGEITPEALAVAAELQHEVERAVEAKIFPCNVGICNSQFGKPCVYRDLKWKGDMNGLRKVEKKK